MAKFLKIAEDRSYKDVCEQIRDYVTIMKEVFGIKVADAEEGEEPEPVDIPPVGLIPDLTEDQKIFQWAGIGFGDAETYRLMKSLKKLSTETGLAKIRFFGKIRGTEKDYYIAEAEAEAGDEEGAEEVEKPADFEDRGTGVNKNTYWVAHSSMSEWVKLPDLSPSDIAAARTIKVLFTGDLERQIYTNPFFFKSEKFYLRAQICRIYHSTSLCPKGLFRLVEDQPRDIEDNLPEEGELVLPTTNEMNHPDMWVHHSLGILENCRTAHKEPEVPDDVEITPEELLAQIEAQDPYEPRLKPIVSDYDVLVSKDRKISPWIVTLKGDPTIYKTEAKKDISNAVVVVRSLQWPGAFNFYH